MPDWRPTCSIEVLTKRAQLLGYVRSFFQQRDVLEVDTPAVSRFPAIDQHLDPLKVRLEGGHPDRYLITSPEYHMKRLLCYGSGAIFQICKAFRAEETGRRHNSEFTILEWYRTGWDHLELMDEVDALMRMLLGCEPADRISYVNIFQDCANINPLELNRISFLDCCSRNGLTPPSALTGSDAERNECLDFLMGILVEPSLGRERPVFIHDYPADQASLARINPDNPEFSQRFEVYYKGMELGNGFYELADAAEQAARFKRENGLRQQIGKEQFVIDDMFLAALEHGLPDCAGIAMGLDRLLMLSLDLDSIDRVIPFTWDNC